MIIGEAVDRLPLPIRAEVTGSARRTEAVVSQAAPQLGPPYFLHTLPEQKVDEIVDRAGGLLCVFLGAPTIA